jgi:hypothetical protein
LLPATWRCRVGSAPVLAIGSLVAGWTAELRDRGEIAGA